MLIGLAILCAFVESVFTALEVALGATSKSNLRARLEENRDDAELSLRLTQVLELLENASQTSLLFITATSLSLWTATGLLAWQARLDGWPDWGLPLALVGILFIAEVLPVLIAAPRSDVIALRGSGLVLFASRVLSPLLFLISALGRALARIFGAHQNASPQVSEEELRSALAAAEQEGAIESGERALLEGAMDFRAKVIREVMTPRREIVAVASATPLNQVLETAIREGHSRLPIYDGTLDKVVGIASSKDLMPYLRDGQRVEDTLAHDIARPPFFVPETKKIAPTLEELRGQRSLMAIVVDDEGDTVGLVTLEDLLEEIVGDIQDEYDVEEPDTRVLGEDTIAFEGSVTVREAERFMEKHFNGLCVLHDGENADADDTISLAALALRLFDGIPQAGDLIIAGKIQTNEEYMPINLQVARMDGPRIVEVNLLRDKEKSKAT